MNVILASHLVFTGYGHWLSNDPRGSGSTEIRKDELRQLGDIHFGRKSLRPTKQEIREFYQRANELLDHKPLWFRRAHRDAIANAVAQECRRRGYTCWAFAACSNHAHGVFRTHRDRAEAIWMNLANAIRNRLREMKLSPTEHPIWSHRPYKVFLYSYDDVHGRINYVDENPLKEGLAKQNWQFVTCCPLPH